MSAKRIVMLDFDGVINRVSNIGYYIGTAYEPPIERQLALRVGNMVNKLDALVVVSSDWRHSYTLAELRQFLGDYAGIAAKRVLGTTERGGWKSVRGQEIENWLKEAGEPVRLAVLDDNHLGRFNMDRVRPWFVKTTPQVGVSEANIKDASRLLTTGPIFSMQSIAEGELTNA